MADYTPMSSFYDVIMTAGYYDYGRVATALGRHLDEVAAASGASPRVLELGCGTGLILELLATAHPEASVVGLDVTADMLRQAEQRLSGHGNVHLVRADVRDAHVGDGFDVVFSYGGIWYFVPDGHSYTLISHLRGDDDNRVALERVAASMRPGGRLLLGVQGQHRDYEATIAHPDGDVVYAQSIDPIDDGFRKRYGLRRGSADLMAQTIDYRTYESGDALELLESAGFQLVADPGPEPVFLQLAARR